MTRDSRKSDAWLSLGLAVVGGYGDAAGFILAKTFTGHVTGNLVLGAIALASRNWSAMLLSLVAIITFLLGVFLSVWAGDFPKGPPSRRLLPMVLGVEVLLVIEACMLLRFPMIGGVELFVVCMSLALGLQNGAFRHTGGISVHTTYLTGLITSLIVTEAEKYNSQVLPEQPATRDANVALLYGIWAAFVLGAGIGAVMVRRFKEFGLLGAALVLLALIVHIEVSCSTDLHELRFKGLP